MSIKQFCDFFCNWRWRQKTTKINFWVECKRFINHRTSPQILNFDADLNEPNIYNSFRYAGIDTCRSLVWFFFSTFRLLQTALTHLLGVTRHSAAMHFTTAHKLWSTRDFETLCAFKFSFLSSSSPLNKSLSLLLYYFCSRDDSNPLRVKVTVKLKRVSCFRALRRAALLKVYLYTYFSLLFFRLQKFRVFVASMCGKARSSLSACITFQEQ